MRLTISKSIMVMIWEQLTAQSNIKLFWKKDISIIYSTSTGEPMS